MNIIQRYHNKIIGRNHFGSIYLKKVKEIWKIRGDPKGQLRRPLITIYLNSGIYQEWSVLYLWWNWSWVSGLSRDFTQYNTWLFEAKKISSRWIPHELTEKNRKERVRICKQNLEKFKSNKWKLSDVVTGDECWFF
jgi:hypothetical protein